MSLNKSIASGKEHRVEYGTKDQPFCKSVDHTCRNHGGRSGGASNQCPWCLGNRTHSNKKREQAAMQRFFDFWFIDLSELIGKKYKEKHK